MALEVSGLVDLRLAMIMAVRDGDSVVEVCARFGVSRQTYYRYARRFAAAGVAGLEDRSRRPHCSPGEVPRWVEDEILLVRKEHRTWGARKIRRCLVNSGVLLDSPVPAASTVHRVLVAHGEVVPSRAGRRQQCRRFRAAAPNLRWQTDGWRHVLDGGGLAWVVDIVDDHSSFLLASRAGPALTGAAAWQAFRGAVAEYGLPGRLQSDNGTTYTGRLHGFEVSFERQLRAAGVPFSHTAVRHPQTNGKDERVHRTTREWLRDEPPARTVEQLQQRLDRFRRHYNTERPHEALNFDTPAEHYQPGTPIQLPPIDLDPADDYPPEALLRRVSPRGSIKYQRHTLDLGTRWADVTVGLIRRGGRVLVYYGQSEIATFLTAADPH